MKFVVVDDGRCKKGFFKKFFKNVFKDIGRLFSTILSAVQIAIVVAMFVPGVNLIVALVVAIVVAIVAVGTENPFLLKGIAFGGMIASLVLLMYGEAAMTLLQSVFGSASWIVQVAGWLQGLDWYWKVGLFAFSIFSTAAMFRSVDTGETYFSALGSIVGETVGEIVGAITDVVSGVITGVVTPVLGAVGSALSSLWPLAIGAGLLWYLSSSSSTPKVIIEDQQATLNEREA